MVKTTDRNTMTADTGLEQASIQRALVEAQRALGPIPKDGKNTFHGYDYTTAEAIVKACRAALNAAGLAATADQWSFTTTEGGTVLAEITCTLVHEGGEVHERVVHWPVVPEKGRPIDKAVAVALTAALAYWLRSLLLAPRCNPDEDMDRRDDRKVAQPAPQRRQRKAPAAKPAPPPAPKADAVDGPDVPVLIDSAARKETADGREYVVVSGSAYGRNVSAFVFDNLEAAEALKGPVVADIETRKGSLVITSWRRSREGSPDEPQDAASSAA